MDIIVIHKDQIQFIPPVISSCLNLSRLGHHVTLIDEGVPNNLKRVFKDNGISIVEIPRKKLFYDKFSLLYSYYKFRKSVKQYLSKNAGPDTYLWIEGGQTINCLGCTIKHYKFILQISELHEQQMMQFKAIGRIINDAKIVFMPEYNRTVLYQVWFKMEHRPIVLPNKPYFIPEKVVLEELKDKYKDIVKTIEGKKIVLYQGYIGYDRDISAIVRAVKQLGDDFLTVVVGKDCGILKEYRLIDSRIVHINHLPAPDYLLFTSMAYIGVLTYVPDSINNIFCAPNKIFEYGAFGLPMLGNDIPGLKVLEYEKAGRAVDITNETEVLDAIKDIDMNFKQYSNASKALFDKADNTSTIKKSLDKLIKN